MIKSKANLETFLALQIEDREAVECVEEIAALGVDSLFVGPRRLYIHYGASSVEHAIDRVASTANKAGKRWGTTSASPEAAQRALDRGSRMITCGSDHALVRGFQNTIQEFSELKIR